MCRIGFHAHNNQGDALEKTQAAVEAGARMIDSCMGGLGRGAGNLESEVAALRFQAPHKDSRIVMPLLEFLDRHVMSKQEYRKRLFAMRHPLYILAGYLDLHPDFVDHLIGLDTDIATDMEVMHRLDVETRASNMRNFSLKLLKDTLEKWRQHAGEKASRHMGS
jgi:4-hydroxy 2-oxovalerate aldolase